MFNFNKLQPVADENYSFVGIEKRNSEIKFCLPRGFKTGSFATYDSKRDLFFLLYKVLRQFKTICTQRDYLKDDRDGVVENKGSVQKITLPDADSDEEQPIIYSKLDSINTILSLYDEPKILSLAHRLGISDKIDYTKIHKFLHACTYMGNGTAYIDLITLPKRQVLYQSTDIVAMYCYILSEIKQQLKEDISGEVQTLADDFSHRYIGVEYSLFDEDYCTLTVGILQDALELIEHQTPIKDVDYWLFHDAIELFLYGELSEQEEGEIWGISNFHSVWESICLTYIAKNLDSKYILYLDTKHLSNNVVTLANSQLKIVDLTDVFVINKKKIIPDVVIYATPFANLPELGDFYLTQKSWDDYSYKTTFGSNLDYFSKYYRQKPMNEFKIAYESQCADGKHTIVELEKYYESNSLGLLINSQLPSDFYSYWDIEVVNRLDKPVLALMKRLNHIFYVAIENNAYNAETFYDFLVDKFDVKRCYNFHTNFNPFRDSLLRGCSFSPPSQLEKSNLNEYEIVLKFKNFLQLTSSYLKIIDVKYLDLDYFMSDTNIQDLKQRSVRKQFVYEYLLQQHIKEINILKNIEIQSSFWLPSWRQSDKVHKISSEYLDGYIYLNSLNFSVIVNNYFD